MAKYIKKRKLIHIYLSKDEDAAEFKKYIDMNIEDEEDSDNWIYLLNESFAELDEELKEKFYEIVEHFKDQNLVSDVLVIEKAENIDAKYIKELKKNGIRNVEIKAYSQNQYILSQIGDINFKEIEVAVKALKFRRMRVFLEMQIGLPESNELDEIQTARTIAKLKPYLVKIRPVLVFKNTLLSEKLENSEYKALTIEEAVNLTKKLVIFFRTKKIEEIQIGFDEYDQVETNIKKDKNSKTKIMQRPEYIAGPYDENFNFFVYSSIYYDKIIEIIKRYNMRVKEIEIEANPNITKYILGFDGINLENLKRLYDIKAELKQSTKISTKDIKVNITNSYTDFIDG